MAGTAPDPTQQLLLNQMNLNLELDPALAPVAQAAAQELFALLNSAAPSAQQQQQVGNGSLAQGAEGAEAATGGGSSSGATAGRSPLEAVLTSRVAVVEGKLEGVNHKLDMVLEVLRQNGSAGGERQSKVDRGDMASACAASAASGLPANGTLLTNGNIAKTLPAVDRQTQELLASGSLLPHISKGALGNGSFSLQQPSVLLPVHVVNERGKRELADQDDQVIRVARNSSGLSELAIASSSNLPGNGKIPTAAAAAEKLPSFQKWSSASHKVSRILQAKGLMSEQECAAYSSYEELMVEISEDFTAPGLPQPAAWQLFIGLDQDLRVHAFEKELSLGYLDGVVCARLHTKAYSKLEALSAASGRPRGRPSGGVPKGAQDNGIVKEPSPWRELYNQIPQAHRAGVCVPFYFQGACDRKPRCKFAATGHKCAICNATTHGTAQHEAAGN
jgi:hypothetical protein